jgi:hypothetical protein
LYTNIKETNYVHEEKQYKKIQKLITCKRESKNKETNIKRITKNIKRVITTKQRAKDTKQITITQHTVQELTIQTA